MMVSPGGEGATSEGEGGAGSLAEELAAGGVAGICFGLRGLGC